MSNESCVLPSLRHGASARERDSLPSSAEDCDARHPVHASRDYRSPSGHDPRPVWVRLGRQAGSMAQSVGEARPHDAADDTVNPAPLARRTGALPFQNQGIYAERRGLGWCFRTEAWVSPLRYYA